MQTIKVVDKSIYPFYRGRFYVAHQTEEPPHHGTHSSGQADVGTLNQMSYHMHLPATYLLEILYNRLYMRRKL
jgi:hypothetical protein